MTDWSFIWVFQLHWSGHLEPQWIYMTGTRARKQFSRIQSKAMHCSGHWKGNILLGHSGTDPQAKYLCLILGAIWKILCILMALQQEPTTLETQNAPWCPNLTTSNWAMQYSILGCLLLTNSKKHACIGALIIHMKVYAEHRNFT